MVAGLAAVEYCRVWVIVSLRMDAIFIHALTHLYTVSKRRCKNWLVTRVSAAVMYILSWPDPLPRSASTTTVVRSRNKYFSTRSICSTSQGILNPSYCALDAKIAYRRYCAYLKEIFINCKIDQLKTSEKYIYICDAKTCICGISYIYVI